MPCPKDTRGKAVSKATLSALKTLPDYFLKYHCLVQPETLLKRLFPVALADLVFLETDVLTSGDLSAMFCSPFLRGKSQQVPGGLNAS